MTPEDEQKRVKERDRGAQAKRIFESPIWQESYEILANQYLEAMLSESTTDEESLELKRRILALSKVKTELTQVMETGRMAEMQLERAKHATDRDQIRRARAAR